MHWILTSERTDEYELSIDTLPPMLDNLDLSFDDGNFVATTPLRIEVPFSQHPEEYIADNIVAPTRLGLLINEKLKTVFNSLDIDNIQYFPASLRDINTDKVKKDYWVANIIGKIACIDYEQSNLVLFNDGDIEFIDKLVLKLSACTDYDHIFRMAEFPPILIISDDLKQALEQASITGLRICQPETFSL